MKFANYRGRAMITDGEREVYAAEASGGRSWRATPNLPHSYVAASSPPTRHAHPQSSESAIFGVPTALAAKARI